MTVPLASKQGQLAPLRNANPEEVLQRYLAEETTKDIAKSFGVTRAALNFFLLEHAEKEWKQAQVVRALKRKEEAEDEMDSAQDALTLARARERLKAAQWDLERVCRRIYGQDAPPAGLQVLNVTIGIRRDDATNAVQHSEPTVIDHDGDAQVVDK